MKHDVVVVVIMNDFLHNNVFSITIVHIIIHAVSVIVITQCCNCQFLSAIVY